MSTLLESYRILGVNVGADMATVTTSYKQLCREYHPDISDKPEAEELMKQVNIAYMVLRDKFKREAAMRERASGIRQTRRYTPDRPRQERQEPQRSAPKEQPKKAPDPKWQAAEQYHRKAAQQAAVSAEAESSSYKVLHDYFKALNTYDYKKAYSFLSEHDKKNIPLDSFIKWRESVAKLYPLREFKIAARSSVAVVTWGGNSIFHARKFKVIVKEDNLSTENERSDELDKLVIIEDGQWRVFLGYREVGDLTKTFEERFERRTKLNIEERFKEYCKEINIEYDMYTMTGMKKAATKEIYRQRRYGSPITFAALSIKLSEEYNSGLSELLRSAAKTISSSLREIDLAAYAGDGIFAILFVELGKKNAQNTINRLVEAIRANAEHGLGDKAEIEYTFNAWSENRYADFDDINGILQRYGKRL